MSQQNLDESVNLKVTHVATNANNIDIQDTEHDILEKLWKFNSSFWRVNASSEVNIELYRYPT